MFLVLGCLRVPPFMSFSFSLTLIILLLLLQAKARLLKETLHKINQKHGAGTIMSLSGETLPV